MVHYDNLDYSIHVLIDVSLYQASADLTLSSTPTRP